MAPVNIVGWSVQRSLKKLNLATPTKFHRDLHAKLLDIPLKASALYILAITFICISFQKVMDPFMYYKRTGPTWENYCLGSQKESPHD